MRLTITSTPRLVEVDGVHARVWEGRTGSNVPVQVLVVSVTTLSPDAETREALAAELITDDTPPVIRELGGGGA